MSTQDIQGTGDEGERPLRATTVERERVLNELSDATARGQIELGEFDERAAAAWHASTRGELAELLSDIVVDPMSVLRAPGDRPDRPRVVSAVANRPRNPRRRRETAA